MRITSKKAKHLNTDRRHILLVINPAAGRSTYKNRLRHLEERLTEAGLHFEHFFTEPDAGGRLRAKFEETPGLNEVIVMGGDGTLNYAVNELHEKRILFSIVSNGTGNDSVKSLHGETNFRRQVEIAIKGKTGEFDLGMCNARVFVNGVGIGFDGQVVQLMKGRRRKRGSHLDYLLTVLRTVAGFKERPLRFTIDGKAFQRTILMMTISNGTTFGGGFVINPFARSDDGLLDVCLLNEISPLRRFRHLYKLKSGAHHKLEESEFLQAKQIRVDFTDQLVAHLDGEYLGHPPFDISVVPKGLLFRVPAG